MRQQGPALRFASTPLDPNPVAVPPASGGHRTPADQGLTSERRGWDLNPRSREGHTISNRADSAALAPLLGWEISRVSCGDMAWRRARRSGPAQRRTVNRVRA